MSIKVTDLSKEFVLRTNQTLLARLVAFARSEKQRRIQAVRNVSFCVRESEVIGIIGRNGSGKSTLLRLLARIFVPDTGTIVTNGRITPLIGLGIGTFPRLNMRDNIYILCSTFGMLREEIRHVFDQIVDFSELGEYLDTQIYQFSAGMIQRLFFSVAVFSSPEILLLDEVFSAGDAAFREKSYQKMEELVRGDCTVVMTTHDMGLAQKVCDRVLWMQNGSLIAEGEPEVIAEKYLTALGLPVEKVVSSTA